MTAIIKFVPQIPTKYIDTCDNIFNFDTINKSLIAFFSGRDTPIMINDISTIEKLAKNLYPFYFTHITQKDDIYDFSIIKNIELDIPYKYILDITVYCNEKIFVNAQIESWEYTQSSHTNYITCVITLDGNETTKTFDLIKKKYVAPAGDKLVTKSDDLEQLISEIDLNVRELFDESYPYNVIFSKDTDKNNFTIKYQNDAHRFNWKMTRRIDLNDINFNDDKKYGCFSAEQDGNILECMFEDIDFVATISMCGRLSHFDYTNICTFTETFNIICEFMCVTYNGTDVTFLSQLFCLGFDEKNVTVPKLSDIYRCSIYFTSDFNESTRKGFTIIIEQGDHCLTISTIKDNINMYHYVSRIFSYDIISAEPVKKVVFNIFFSTMASNNSVMQSECFKFTTINFGQIFNLKLMYLQMQVSDFDTECCVRKQIYDDGEIVFDGLITYVKEHSDVYISLAYHSTTNYEFICNNEKIPGWGEYSYGSIPTNCTNKKAEIFINNCKPDAVARCQNIFNVPDFVINKDIDLCIAYIDTQFNKFCLKQNNIILIYGKENKLIAKKIELDVGFEITVFDANTAATIYTGYYRFHENDLTCNEKFYYGKYLIYYSTIATRGEHLSKTTTIFKNDIQIFSRFNIIIKDGEMQNNNIQVIDEMTDADKLYLKYDGCEIPTVGEFYKIELNDLVQNTMMMYEEIWDESINLVGAENTSIDNIVSFDKKFSFEIRHTLVARECGNGPITAKKTVVTNKDDKGNTINIRQHNYDSRGHSKNKKIIDASNKYIVKSHSQKEVYDGHVGYKAARTKDYKMCIVKLFVPGEAKVAWEPRYNKYRTNLATVISIRTVTCVNNKFYYENDLLIEECIICKNSLATHLSFPCRHKLCNNCWDIALEKWNKCLLCSSKVRSVEKIDIEFSADMLEKVQTNKILQSDNTVRKAYSFIHTNDFVYKLGESIMENNFDGNLDKTCLPGIHYHSEDSDAFKWFEYMDIPEQIQLPEMQIGESLIDHVTDQVCDSVDTFDMQTLKKRNVALNIQDSDSSEEYDPKKPPQIKIGKKKID
jgi:hypothetical protein